MEVRDLPLELLTEAPWNPNEADEATLAHLAASIGRFGTVLPLIVRPLGDAFEVLGGNQRLKVYRSQAADSVPCVVTELDDARARLLAQVLNAVHGTDDLARKAELVRRILEHLPEPEVLAVLPDTADALRGLVALGQQTAGSLAAALTAWDRARSVRLERISFPFTARQREIVEEAIAQALPRVSGGDGPNRRAMALVEVCIDWLRARPAV